MLTEEQIIYNKNRFIALVSDIQREGVDKERLLRQLENSDFFEAPASAIYHNCFRGGLCAHCLNVYDTMIKMCQAMYTNQVTKEDGEVETVFDCPYTEESIRIIALFHDFDKMNKYEKTVMNKKVYSEVGSKHDEMGKFDWVSVPGYKRKEAKDIFMMGTHGENSAYMTETFIPLSTEEHSAILCHHSKYDNPSLDTTGIYNRFNLACLLHLADMASTYILERT